MSNGAPASICRARTPDEANENVKSAKGNPSLNSASNGLRSDAAATVNFGRSCAQKFCARKLDNRRLK